MPMIAAEHVTTDMRIILTDSTTAQVIRSEPRANTPDRWFLRLDWDANLRAAPASLSPLYDGSDGFEPLRGTLVEVN